MTKVRLLFQLTQKEVHHPVEHEPLQMFESLIGPTSAIRIRHNVTSSLSMKLTRLNELLNYTQTACWFCHEIVESFFFQISGAASKGYPPVNLISVPMLCPMGD